MWCWGFATYENQEGGEQVIDRHEMYKQQQFTEKKVVVTSFPYKLQ
jgi:hypothetical protein